MQPAPSERARFLKIVMGGLLLLGVTMGGAGCTAPASQGTTDAPFGTIDTIATTEAPRDSALAVLARLDRTAFDSAFAHLDAYAFTRHVRTEQLDTTGTTTAARTLTLRYAPGTAPGTLQRADSIGTFRQGGFFSAITPPQQPRARPGNLAAQALPDQPAYLAPRTQEAYRYALRRDSLLDGTPVVTVEARARSWGQGADQSIRYARLTMEQDSHALVGLTTLRTSQILLFREQSALTLRLRPSAGQDWVPHLTRVRAVVDLPFRAPRQFRTVSGYYAYEASDERS